jgi:hypothetical protein
VSTLPKHTRVDAFAMRMTQIDGEPLLVLVCADDRGPSTTTWGPAALGMLSAYLTRFEQGENFPTEPGEEWCWSVGQT